MTQKAVFLLEKQGIEVTACDHIRNDSAQIDLRLDIGKKRVLLLCEHCVAPIEVTILRNILEKAAASALKEKMTLR